MLFVLAGCDRAGDGKVASEPSASTVACPPGNGGIAVPAGFCADIVADNLGSARHLAVSPQGRIYVTLRNQQLDAGGLLMLVDVDRDGHTDRIEQISEEPGLGIAISGGHLYFGADRRVVRYPLDENGAAEKERMEVLIEGFPPQPRHGGKSLTVDGENNLFVNVGAPGNACQEEEGKPGSRGLDPCPQLAEQAAIWRFSASRSGQRFPSDGARFATGVRNAYAIDWHPQLNALFVVQHGRDALYEHWPEHFNASDGAELPAEELLRLEEGGTYGWPYCYFDPRRDQLLLAPEYGGDGSNAGRCVEYSAPVVALPAHFGPNDMVFYGVGNFPRRYHGGAFIAFHGSYNRGPFGQQGYEVGFIPLAGESLSGNWEVFAGDFAGRSSVARPEDAEYRPTGVAVGPEGSLYVADSVQGRIWRIYYLGQALRAGR